MFKMLQNISYKCSFELSVQRILKKMLKRFISAFISWKEKKDFGQLLYLICPWSGLPCKHPVGHKTDAARFGPPEHTYARSRYPSPPQESKNWNTCWEDDTVNKLQNSARGHMRGKAAGDCEFWPNAFNQRIHALVHKVSICLALSKALLLKQPCEGGKVIRWHLEVCIIQEQDLQQQGLLL